MLKLKYEFTIENFEHSKTGEQFQLLKIVEKLSKDDFMECNRLVKMSGGFYSKFAKGFLIPLDVEITQNSDNLEDEEEIEILEKSLFELLNENNLVKLEIKNKYDRVTIGKNIKKQLSEHFKQYKLKLSVSTKGYSSINIVIKESIFDKNSPCLQNILKYCNKLYDLYNECTRYDPYGDYGSSYLFCGDVSIDYNYKTIETNVNVLEIEQNFELDMQEQKRIEFENDRIRWEQEEKERELQKIESEKIEKIRQEQIQEIEQNVKIVELSENEQYYANANFGYGKENSLKELTENSEREKNEYRKKETKNKIKKEVYFSTSDYEKFTKLFLYDFSFIKNTGGSCTDDIRINSMIDYNRLTVNEQSTIEWYNTNCVAIYCDNELKLVIDAQGYNYCRYVGIVSGNKYNLENIESTEELDNLVLEGEILEDISTNIIIENNLQNNNEWKNSEIYDNLFIEYLENNNKKLTIEIIQQIRSENLKLKLYNIYDKLNSLDYQFKNANLKEGDKITIFKMSSLGGVSASKITINEIKYNEQTIEIICNFYRKKGLYSVKLNKNDRIVITEGHQELSEDVLYNVKNENGVTTKSMILFSFDEGIFTRIKEHFNDNNIKMLVVK